ncbi:MAG TPA: universal stress protein [Solirubrobacteraceae bacterium]|jgi:nucleotide-binding universal stress UspA family protein
MFQRILTAWDGSPVAVRAFDVAIDITRRYNAELVAVSIAYSPAHAETAADRDESADAAHRYLTDTFHDVADRAVRAGVSVEHQIIDGDTPAQALADYAHEHSFDLIICGHHHTRRAGRLLLRGVAQDLLAITTIPILIVSNDDQ